MSTVLVQRAWRQQLPSTQKLLLLALADRAGDRGANEHCCWPTVAQLAEVVGVTRMTIFASLNALETHGLVTRERRPKGPSTYRLNLPAEVA